MDYRMTSFDPTWTQMTSNILCWPPLIQGQANHQKLFRNHFLKPMSERDGSDIYCRAKKWQIFWEFGWTQNMSLFSTTVYNDSKIEFWISRSTQNRLKTMSFEFEVVPFRIRLFPTFQNKMPELPLFTPKWLLIIEIIWPRLTFESDKYWTLNKNGEYLCYTEYTVGSKPFEIFKWQCTETSWQSYDVTITCNNLIGGTQEPITTEAPCCESFELLDQEMIQF